MESKTDHGAWNELADRVERLEATMGPGPAGRPRDALDVALSVYLGIARICMLVVVVIVVGLAYHDSRRRDAAPAHVCVERLARVDETVVGTVRNLQNHEEVLARVVQRLEAVEHGARDETNWTASRLRDIEKRLDEHRCPGHVVTTTLPAIGTVTLTGPVVTLASPPAVTTNADIIYTNAAGWTRLAPGTPGQVLTVDSTAETIDVRAVQGAQKVTVTPYGDFDGHVRIESGNDRRFPTHAEAHENEPDECSMTGVRVSGALK